MSILARTKFARSRAKKYFDIICELTQMTGSDDPSVPQVRGHKAWLRGRLEAWTFFAGAQTMRPGGSPQDPPINVTQQWIEFPLYPENDVLIAQTDRDGNYINGGVEILPSDQIIAKGITYVVHGFRGPKSTEVSRFIDVERLGTVGT